MFKELCIPFAVLTLIASTSFASTLKIETITSGEKVLQGTYDLAKKPDGTRVSKDGALMLQKQGEIRNKSQRADAFVFEGIEIVSVGGKKYTLHTVSMTEKTGLADGVFKLFDEQNKVVETGTYSYVSDKAPVKTGKL